MNCEYYAPSLFLNHGGGPYPVMGEINNIAIAESLRNVSQIVDLKSLKAIIVVTAHREEEIVTISSGERHELVYDYGNFPPETYKYMYNAPGEPVLAEKINNAFKKQGISSKLDSKRGWDHGVFIPMMLINPNADIPIVQVSILKNQDSTQHYAIGRVLEQFRKESVVVFGSGMSYHNMKRFGEVVRGNDGVVENEDFDTFLTKACTGGIKRESILSWKLVPQGLESHPEGEADHLMPLIVNAGAGGSENGRKIFETIFLGKFLLSGFIWDK